MGKRVCILQVTDSKEHILKVGILVSAADSGLAFDLRCNVREKLVTFIQQHYPNCLSKTRTEILPASAIQALPLTEG